MPALRHMRRLGNWLARLAVDQVPCGHAGSSPARRTTWCEEGPADGRRRQPSRKRKALTGVRVRSSLPPPCGRRRRGGPAPGCYPGRGLGHEVRLLHLPPGSVGPVGVDVRLSSGRSRVRVPYGAQVAGRSAVVAAGCQSGLSIRAARVRSPSTAHHTRPHGLAVKDARFSAGRTPVRARLGVPMLSWRNRQTHRLQVAAPPWRVGSTPTESTRSTPTCRNGRRAALRARCPSGREGSTPSVGTCGTTGGGDRCPGLPCKQARRGSIPRRSTSRHGGETVYADEAHVDAHLLAMQETAGSRPVIRSIREGKPAWRNQVDARRSGRRSLRGIPVRVRGRVRNGL